MTWRRPQYNLADLVLLVIVCSLTAAMHHAIFGAADSPYSLTMLVFLEGGMIVWFILWTFQRRMRQGPVCAECGQQFLPFNKFDQSLTCPRCRRRATDPAHMRKEVVMGFRLFLFIGVLVAVLIGTLLFDFAQRHFPESHLLVLPFLAVGATLLLLLVIVLVHVIRVMVRTRGARNERYAPWLARKSAGEEGTEVNVGPHTFWYSGSNDPVPMLTEQMEMSRNRFESLVEKAEPERPLRVFCFDKLASLTKYHWHFYTAIGDLSGCYMGGAHPVITISTEVPPHRLIDTERTARIVFSYFYMENLTKSFPFPWLSQGLGNCLACNDDGAELENLNRRMIVSLAKGTSLASADLFLCKPHTAIRHLNKWYEHAVFTHYAQFSGQSWSLVEYLAGTHTQQVSRERFRAFLKETNPKEPPEERFRRHFGCGFDELLEGWKKWVKARSVGNPREAPPALRDALAERVIPTIQNSNAKIMNRIQAVRDMGRAGYGFGADALIELLRPGSGVPKQETVWALEAIAGMAWGDDERRWKAWWEGLPPSVRGDGSY